MMMHDDDDGSDHDHEHVGRRTEGPKRALAAYGHCRFVVAALTLEKPGQTYGRTGGQTPDRWFMLFSMDAGIL